MSCHMPVDRHQHITEREGEEEVEEQGGACVCQQELQLRHRHRDGWRDRQTGGRTEKGGTLFIVTCMVNKPASSFV